MTFRTIFPGLPVIRSLRIMPTEAGASSHVVSLELELASSDPDIPARRWTEVREVTPSALAAFVDALSIVDDTAKPAPLKG